jgi:hypothetical protein
MSLRVGSVVMGASDVRRAMTFCGQALGYVPREEPDGTWVVLTPAFGGGPNISLTLSETPVQARPRVHLDLYARDRSTGYWGLARRGWTGWTTRKARTSSFWRTPRVTASALSPTGDRADIRRQLASARPWSTRR